MWKRRSRHCRPVWPRLRRREPARPPPSCRRIASPGLVNSPAFLVPSALQIFPQVSSKKKFNTERIQLGQEAFVFFIAFAVTWPGRVLEIWHCAIRTQRESPNHWTLNHVIKATHHKHHLQNLRMNEYYNNCSERAWKCNFPSFVGNYGRQNDGPTERPTDWHEGL